MNNTFKINNTKIEINFNGGSISSNGGLLMIKEFADKINLKHILKQNVKINDGIKHRLHNPHDNILQQIYSIIAGYEDNNDATHLRNDKVFQTILEKDVLASQSTLCRLDNSYKPLNIEQLQKANLELIDRFRTPEQNAEIVLDIDSTDDLTYGKQEGSMYNTHYKHNVYHPLYCFDGNTNDLLKVTLRDGNFYSGNGVVGFIEPLLKRYQGTSLKSRADSGFAMPELYELYEKEEYNVTYYIKLKSNRVLIQKAKEHLDNNFVELINNNPYYFSFTYKAESWTKERRILCKTVQIKGEEDLLPCVTINFVVTNDLFISPEDGFEYYNGRANVENNIKEMKIDFNSGKLSLSQFVFNACKLQVFAISYNLFNLLRRNVLVGSMKKERMITLRTKLIKIGCKVVNHAKRLIFKLSSGYTFQSDFLLSCSNIAKIQV